jgi:putative endopeptidase
MRLKQLVAFAAIALLGTAPNLACTDFYQAANAAWLSAHVLLRDDPIMNPYSIAQSRNDAAMLALLEAESKRSNEANPARAAAGTFYASCMDRNAVEAAGLAPLRDEFRRIDLIRDRRSLAIEVGRLHDRGIPAFFDLSVALPMPGTTRVVAIVDVEPVSDLEFAAIEDSEAGDPSTMASYAGYVWALFRLIGDPPALAASEAEAAIALRLRLAADISDDGQKSVAHVVRGVSQLRQYLPSFDWEAYAAERHLGSGTRIGFTSLKYASTVASELRDNNVARLVSYLRFTLISSESHYLSDVFERTASGGESTESLPERRLECMQTTVDLLPRETGVLWRQAHDVTAIERRARNVIARVQHAIRQLIVEAKWLSPIFRQALERRFDTVTIAFESEPLPSNQSEPVLSRDTFAANALVLVQRHVAQTLASIGRPLRSAGLLELTPTQVDADYRYDLNVIELPWGILQSPILSGPGNVASDMGSLGTLIGHEYMHALDPRIRYVGEATRRTQQWGHDLRHYRQRIACVAGQLATFRDTDGARLDVANDIDEAFADLGGLEAAYRALPKTDGASKARFFVAFAHTLVGIVDRSEIASMRQDDVHPPFRVRVDATVANLQAFARIFHCAKNEPMVQPARQRCSAWQ